MVIADWDVATWGDIASIVSGLLALVGALMGVLKYTRLNPTIDKTGQHTSEATDLKTTQSPVAPRSLIKVLSGSIWKYFLCAGVGIYFISFCNTGISGSIAAVSRLRQASAFVGAGTKEHSGGDFAKHRFGHTTFTFKYETLEHAHKDYAKELETHYRAWVGNDEQFVLNDVEYIVKRGFFGRYLTGIRINYDDSAKESRSREFKRDVFYSADETTKWANSLSEIFEKNGFRSYPQASSDDGK